MHNKKNTPKSLRDMSKTENNRKLSLGNMRCTYLQVLSHVLQMLNVATTSTTYNINSIQA